MLPILIAKKNIETVIMIKLKGLYMLHDDKMPLSCS